MGGVSETSWVIFNNKGSSIYTSGLLAPNTQYKDTLTFNNGCYALYVTDSDDDGLDFWANNDGGGMLRFRRLNPFIDTTSVPWAYHNWFKTFELDFILDFLGSTKFPIFTPDIKCVPGLILA